MYIEDFESFYQQAEELYRSRPLETRYCIKYRNSDGKLAIKVTDDRTCLQFKTDQQADLKKLERLNNLFFTLMAKGDATPEELAALEQQQQPAPVQQHHQHQHQQHQQQSQQQQSKKNRKKG